MVTTTLLNIVILIPKLIILPVYHMTRLVAFVLHANRLLQLTHSLPLLHSNVSVGAIASIVLASSQDLPRHISSQGSFELLVTDVIYGRFAGPTLRHSPVPQSLHHARVDVVHLRHKNLPGVLQVFLLHAVVAALFLRRIVAVRIVVRVVAVRQGIVL